MNEYLLPLPFLYGALTIPFRYNTHPIHIPLCVLCGPFLMITDSIVLAQIAYEKLSEATENKAYINPHNFVFSCFA